MEEHIEKALYSIPDHVDYTDIPEDIDEEDLDTERISVVTTLLHHEERGIQLKAALLLTHWGKDKGFEKLIQFLDDDDYIENEGYSAHRLRNYNDTYEHILSALLSYQAIGYDHNISNIKELVFPHISKIIEKSNHQSFSIDHLYYRNDEQYIPLFKNHLRSIISDQKNNYWKIHDVLKKLLETEKDWVYQFLKENKIKLKDFGLQDD